MPAIRFEKIVVPAERDQIVARSLRNQPSAYPGSRKPVAERRPEDGAQAAPGRGRSIVVNWLDRLVERRMEKVERDIARIRKKSDGKNDAARPR